MYVTSLPPDRQFDYVIVGAGSSDCALANRLSADGKHQVLLLEAGERDNHINIHVPMLVARVLMDPRFTWPFRTEPQTHLNGKEQLWVDPQLRVRGIGNLRVVASSICPKIPSSNTNAAALAIGEKGADLILSAAT